MIEPHGGHLVDNLVDPSRYESWLQDEALDLPTIQLSEGLYQDALNIANGRFSPLRGFMKQDDLLRVARDMTLEDGTVWPLPITLDVGKDLAGLLSPGTRAPLADPDGELFGFIDVEEVYRYNDGDIAGNVFGTDDPEHPGVRNFQEKDEFLVGGDVTVFDDQRYNDHDLRPIETRVLFRKYGWDTVVGFQTRNAPHRGHEFIQKVALELVDGLLIHPKIGKKKTGDYEDDVILGAYDRLIENYYADNQVSLSVFPSRMRYAGPREAVFDSIVRKNQGCTHFIIGRDHAGVGDYYDSDQSRNIFDRINYIGIEPMLFNHAFYCSRCDGMCSDKVCPHTDDDRVYPSGTKIRNLIEQGKQPTPKMMRPEVAKYIRDTQQPFVEA